MVIEVNKCRKYEVTEPFLCLTANGKRLYNKQTKEEEGIDGDIVQMTVDKGDGKHMILRGPVEGYTCGKQVKIRGVDEMYTPIGSKIIEHASVITNGDEIMAASNWLSTLDETIDD